MFITILKTMKKSLLLLFFLFSFKISYSQIDASVFKQAEPKEYFNNVYPPYDSTYNLPLEINAESYVGQTLYFHGLRKKSDGYLWIYSIERPGKPYGSGEYTSRTKYEDLYGKYFVVDSVRWDKKITKERISKYRYTLFVSNKEDKEDRAKINVHLSNKRAKTWGGIYVYPQWITVSFYNYLKSQIGNEYMCLSEHFEYVNGKSVYKNCLNSYDIVTGEHIEFKKKEMWKLVDISIDANTQRLMAVMKNNKGCTTFCELVSFEKYDDGNTMLLSKREYERLVKEYGNYYVDCIFDGIIREGMPKEIFLIIKGVPDRKNISSYNEQWVYEGSSGFDCYYFERNVLDSWN